MKVLHVHNYHVGRGGLEVIFDYTTRLLRQRGDEVMELTRDSADLKTAPEKLGALASAVYSRKAYRQTMQLIESHRPDVAYIHNLYPMLSTSVLDACRRAGVPTVMNVQDYKMTCPMGQHLRNGAICTKCLDGSVAWSAIHACKTNRITSAGYAVAHGATRIRKAYQRGIDVFATPAQFVANHMACAGFDRAKFEILPNMCDLTDDAPPTEPGKYAAYVGRISPEKGIRVLIEAATRTNIPTNIAGKGEVPGLRESAPPHVRFVGAVSRQALPDFYRNARFVVVPSIWYEVFSVVLTEALTLGIPVIATGIGGTPEVFEHERSGLLVPPGDAGALAAAMQRLWQDDALWHKLSQGARAHAKANFTPDIYYRNLTRVFERAIKDRRASAAHAGPAGDNQLQPTLQGNL